MYVDMCVDLNTKARPWAQPTGNSRQAEVYGTEFPPTGARHRFNHNDHKRNNHNHKRNNHNNHNNHNHKRNQGLTTFG